MIFSNVNIDEYKKYPAAIQKAVEFLKSHDFTAMEPGTYKIEGDDIYANVFDALTEPAAQRNPESHKEYLDVQYVVTEYGVVNLKPLTTRDRARALIDLAHPDCRGMLTAEAKKLGLL